MSSLLGTFQVGQIAERSERRDSAGPAELGARAVVADRVAYAGLLQTTLPFSPCGSVQPCDSTQLRKLR